MSYVSRWKRREQRYTSKYSAQVYEALTRQWKDAIRQYTFTGQFTIDEKPLEVVYRRLYSQIATAEAELAIADMAADIPRTKDLFSTIANLFSRTDKPLTVKTVRAMMAQYFDMYVIKRLASVTETTRRHIQEAIDYVVNKGLSPKDAIRYFRDKSEEINRTRSIRIARTETISAANRTQLLAHEMSPYVYLKSWLSVVDDVTRDGHLAMNPKNFIELWDLFDVENREGVHDMMLAPGDTEASLSNIVHCRCTLLYEVKKDANGKPIKK